MKDSIEKSGKPLYVFSGKPYSELEEEYCQIISFDERRVVRFWDNGVEKECMILCSVEEKDDKESYMICTYKIPKKHERFVVFYDEEKCDSFFVSGKTYNRESNVDIFAMNFDSSKDEIELKPIDREKESDLLSKCIVFVENGIFPWEIGCSYDTSYLDNCKKAGVISRIKSRFKRQNKKFKLRSHRKTRNTEEVLEKLSKWL